MATKTNSNTVEAVDGDVTLTVYRQPVPAPRPRIRVINLAGGKKMGVAYYVGKYKDFYAEVPKELPDSPIFHEKGTPLEVYVGLHLPRPGSPANAYPVGDVDNYAKSVLDAITKNGTYWHDDAQVVSLHVWKTYTTGPTGFAVTIQTVTIDPPRVTL